MAAPHLIHPPVLARRHPRLLLEQPAEMLWIFKTRFKGYFIDIGVKAGLKAGRSDSFEKEIKNIPI